ncbi:MAG TPA: efflux RND transporter periplasmic adaptor subunit [Candidatus Brocadiaceae bacterium]
MTNKDLSKLKIDKSDAFHYYKKRRKLLSKITVAILVIITGFILYRVVFNPTFKVKVATVSQVYPSQTFTLLNASGYVVAQRKAAVSSKATGRLEWLGVEEGSRVKKGQIIARLENEDVVAARDQAEANLKNALSSLEMVKAEREEATLNYNRQKDLVSHGVVSQSEFDIADARYKKAHAAVTAAESSINAYKAALHAARIAVKYTFIRSPFDAVVLTKNADVGDIITPLGAAANAKAAVVTIADMDSLLVEADVSESNLQKVSAGQPCEIQLDTFPEIHFRGIVHMIVPTADRSKASVMIKVKFLDKDKRVLPEMSARVAFLERPVSPDEQKPKTVLNANAVTEHTGKPFVFLVKDNHAVKTPLVTGILIDNMIEVLQGVKPGDTVIVNPPNRLKNGSGITIQEK